MKKQREQTENNQNNPGKKTFTPILLTRTATSTIITTTETKTKLKEGQKLFTHPVRHVARQTIPQRNATTEPMQPIDRLPDEEERRPERQYQVLEGANHNDLNETIQAAAQSLK